MMIVDWCQYEQVFSGGTFQQQPPDTYYTYVGNTRFLLKQKHKKQPHSVTNLLSYCKKILQQLCLSPYK